ncbi:nucleotide exchange factor GrpE [Asticcacaulis sp. ZE23SCel15]|uniref:nucleotide exchange factor GrpE n=1 Tax=Asticcacaulis sp. ZE23SCel15 TaxID=3059027 RepID=UPI00265F993F|nr:nucleotide exchange factor GrpE [Asticcacaulis sp. ZE23SCel15]WKL58496.1 nucleotide exchange factor GrpE [Asticcacaulis sp. ZE23SCel15]
MTDENLEEGGADLEQDATEILLAELEALKNENVALKEQALRYAAEVENVKRRTEREMNDARAFAIQRFSRDLLGVADILSRALQSAPKDIEDAAFKNFVLGIDMTEKELSQAFEKNGVKKVNPLRGDKFDPNLHQAVMEVPAEDVTGGAVVNVMQTGYELFGRIIRPAMVATAAKTSANSAAASAATSAYAHEFDTGEDPAVDTKA